MRDSCVFYRSFYDSISVLSDDDRLAVYDALFGYALNGVEPELSGTPLAMFMLMKPQIDANNRKYENGKKGGRNAGVEELKENQKKAKPKPKGNQTETKEKPKSNQTETKPKPNVNVNDNVNDNVNVNVNDNGSLADWVRELIPEALQPEFKIWADMRKKMKKPILTRETVKRRYDTLCRLSKNPERQRKIIQQSIDGCWLDFYELKEKESPPIYREFQKEEHARSEPMTDEQRANLEKIRQGLNEAL